MEESKTNLLHHMVEIINFCPKIMMPFVPSKKLNQIMIQYDVKKGNFFSLQTRMN